MLSFLQNSKGNGYSFYRDCFRLGCSGLQMCAESQISAILDAWNPEQREGPVWIARRVPGEDSYSHAVDISG